jgi:hypothetical protein
MPERVGHPDSKIAMSETYFYAALDDLRAVIEDFENRTKVRYFRRGRFDSERAQEYESGLLIPGLGVADSETSATCSGYLVMEAPCEVKARQIDTADGVKFFIDQLANTSSAVFVPAGLWKAVYLLRGSFGSAHRNETADRLLRNFRQSLNKYSEAIRGVRVCREAARLLDQEKTRLTIAEGSSAEYDLVR